MAYLDFIKKQLAGKTICMYPMGIAAKSTMQKLKRQGIEIDFFSDNNPKFSEGEGEIYKGKRCIPKKQLIEMEQDNLVVIVESLYYKEIKRDLQESGIKNILRVYPEKFLTDQFMKQQKNTLQERVKAVLDICADEKSKEIFKFLVDSWEQEDLPDDYFEDVYEKNQYFDPSIVALRDDEVFVDVGAYIGDTAEKFLEFCHGSYEKMHLFELDPEIYKKLEINAKRLEDTDGNGSITCYPYGLSDEKGEVRFAGGDSSSSIQDGKIGDMSGVVQKMEEILEGEKVTFIKMDIEGSELPALRGGRNIIQTQKPKLAICIYHSPEDMLNIPVWIKKLVPEYKIYIRHYTDMMLETVCYAVAEEAK